MTELTRAVQSKVRDLAREGRLIDETFKEFQRQVYPNATPDQVAALRVSFFAGAQEIWALTLFAMNENEDPTEEDLDFVSGWSDEIARFHEKTIEASKAFKPENPN